mmetsp:Transcript_103238/g.182901  ORF Transcript_103238/g.182901 Transcript_103238/m.182901 type:complete len:99 (-) Transcript_103238:23-319(-)
MQSEATREKESCCNPSGFGQPETKFANDLERIFLAALRGDSHSLVIDKCSFQGQLDFEEPIDSVVYRPRRASTAKGGELHKKCSSESIGSLSGSEGLH